MITGAKCSSVERAFAHGAMGRRIDPSWGGSTCACDLAPIYTLANQEGAQVPGLSPFEFCDTHTHTHNVCSGTATVIYILTRFYRNLIFEILIIYKNYFHLSNRRR